MTPAELWALRFRISLGRTLKDSSAQTDHSVTRFSQSLSGGVRDARSRGSSQLMTLEAKK